VTKIANYHPNGDNFRIFVIIIFKIWNLVFSAISNLLY